MQQHGITKFLWCNDLLIVELKGPFNDEGLYFQYEEATKNILSKNFKRWRRLEILDDQTMASPSGLEIVKKLYKWYEDNGCYASAVVTKNMLQTHVLEKRIQGSTVQIFQNLTDAKKWIDEQS